MGNALGIKAPEEPEEDDGDENYDAKAGSQFKVPQNSIFPRKIEFLFLRLDSPEYSEPYDIIPLT